MNDLIASAKYVFHLWVKAANQGKGLPWFTMYFVYIFFRQHTSKAAAVRVLL